MQYARMAVRFEGWVDVLVEVVDEATPPTIEDEDSLANEASQIVNDALAPALAQLPFMDLDISDVIAEYRETLTRPA